MDVVRLLFFGWIGYPLTGVFFFPLIIYFLLRSFFDYHRGKSLNLKKIWKLLGWWLFFGTVVGVYISNNAYIYL